MNKSQQIQHAGFSDQWSWLFFFLIISFIKANQQNIPMSYLLNLQLLQRERKERHGERFVMDSRRMTMTDKPIPNMGTCAVHWMISGSCLKGLVSLLSYNYHQTAHIVKLYLTYLVKYTARHYRVYHHLNWRHVMMTCLTWRTLQSMVFILHFNQHFNMPWGKRRKTTNENWFSNCSTKMQRNDEKEKCICLTPWPGWHMDAVAPTDLCLPSTMCVLRKSSRLPRMFD